MTQRNCRGAYVNFEHDRAADWDWLAKWQPNVIRYMGLGKTGDPNSFDVNRVKRIHETCPDATILLRCWEIDDNNFKAHDAMVANPTSEADKQVEWWARVFDRAAAAGVPRQQLMAGLNNETGPEKDAKLYHYTEWALIRGKSLDMRLGVFVFSVGRPALAGEAEFDIPTFAKLEPLIQQDKGAVIVHEYMQPEGMYAVWTDDQGKERKDYTYLIGRHARWPLSPETPVIIGEWGIDGILYNRHPDKQFGNSGWRNFKDLWPPNRYADEYVECIRKASPNVIAICPFIEDWSDHKWQSFDLIDAYGEFLARKDLCVKDTPSVIMPPIDTGTKPKTMYVTAPAGLNLRSAPRTGNILKAIAYGEAVEVIETEIIEGAPWSYARYGALQGWLFASMLSADKPVTVPDEGPEPTPQPGDNWERSIAWVLEKEGGFQANPADSGNYLAGKLIGTKFGISAAVWGKKYDIPNLTIEQAKSIYFDNYWTPSGAAALPWPQCLLVLDTAILHGVGAATQWLKEVGPNPYAFASKRLKVYVFSEKWEDFGAGWTNRVADLLKEMGR